MGNLNMSAANSPVVFSVGCRITLVSLLAPNRPAAVRCIALHTAVSKIKVSIDLSLFSHCEVEVNSNHMILINQFDIS